MSEWNEAIQKMQAASAPAVSAKEKALVARARHAARVERTLLGHQAGELYDALADALDECDPAGRVEAALSATEGEAEPVAWAYEFHEFGDVWKRHCILNRPDGGANPPTKHHGSEVRNVQPLYASPPSAPAGVKDALCWAMDEIDTLSNKLCQFAYPQGMAMLDRADQLPNYEVAVRIRSSLQPDTQAVRCTYCGDTGTITDRVDGEITCPECGYASPPSAPAGVKVSDIDALADRMWRVTPREVRDSGLTRAQWYAREIRSSLQPDTHSGGPTYVVNCCQCGRIIDTREKADGGDDFGCETTDGRWTCSPECWEVATGDVHPLILEIFEGMRPFLSSAPAQAEALPAGVDADAVKALRTLIADCRHHLSMYRPGPLAQAEAFLASLSSASAQEGRADG